MPLEVIPMPGPAPSPQRRRRNADTFSDVQVTVSAEVVHQHGPDFDDAMGGLIELFDPAVCDLVHQWWDTWRSAPMAEAFLATDWERLRMLAPLVASYYVRPHYTKLAEIRQNESLLGATHVDRLRARIKVERPEPTTVPAGVTALDEYRNRLGSAG